MGGAKVESKQIRVIKTQRDYDDAVARLSAFMDEDIKPHTNQEAELELLALVIESYERTKLSLIHI